MICVDASVAVKWIFIDEVHAELAQALLMSALQTRTRIVAPYLLNAEITNIVRQRMIRTGLSLTNAQTLLHAFRAIPITLFDPDSLYHDALGIAETYNLPATYDAQYLALARLLDCDLWTDDQRLIRSLGNALSFVHAVGDYAPPAST